MRHRERWCKRSVGRGNNKVKNVIVIMSGKSYMLPEIEGGEERENY